ncbi:mechanosensitive ion channel family protein [Synechococcus sp. CS-1328]|uniref:mechanosensitive ion channel family protein n=1 Tax=Synechococcus sp. CS-1328 TaxID=2847976 RepID=UPI00223C166F|nr:mechanosensitive ion channel family protein [Synechococcus sp. CS-1328]MCT0225234.1 mechanosensitive ion channel family protein [Synechococcus sp. CS-1328]
MVAIVLVVRLVNSSLLLLLGRSLRRFGKDKQIATLQGLAPMLRTLFWLLGGLALKGPVSNFIHDLTILLDQPFEIGQVSRSATTGPRWSGWASVPPVWAASVAGAS